MDVRAQLDIGTGLMHQLHLVSGQQGQPAPRDDLIDIEVQCTGDFPEQGVVAIGLLQWIGGQGNGPLVLLRAMVTDFIQRDDAAVPVEVLEASLDKNKTKWYPF